MPRVPSGSGNVVPFAPKPPEEVYIAMAAAQMNQQGELFQPDKTDPLDKKEKPSG